MNESLSGPFHLGRGAHFFRDWLQLRTVDDTEDQRSLESESAATVRLGSDVSVRHESGLG